MDNHCVILLRCIWRAACYHRRHSLAKCFYSLFHKTARTPRELGDEHARATAEFVRTTSWGCGIAPQRCGKRLGERSVGSCCQTSLPSGRERERERERRHGGRGRRREEEGNKLAGTRHKLHNAAERQRGSSKKSGTRGPLRSNLLNKSHPWHSLSTCHLSPCPPWHPSHALLCYLSPDPIQKSGWLRRGRERFFFFFNVKRARNDRNPS